MIPGILAQSATPWGTILWSLGDGVLITLQLTVASLLLSLVVGLTLAIARLSDNAWLRRPAILYIELMRGLPMLVVLLFAYFTISRIQLGEYDIEIPRFLIAVMVFGFAHGAYMAEVFRAGIQSIPKGQTEAARALGLSSRQTMKFVILPQALRNMLPALVNQAITLLKDSSLAYAVAVAELTYNANKIVGATFRTFEIWGLVALFYLILTLGLSAVARELERRQKQDPKAPAATGTA